MAPLSMGKWNSSAGLVHDASQASLVGKASIPGKLELKNQVLLSGDCSDFTDLSNLPLPISISGSTADATDEYGTYPEQPICCREHGIHSVAPVPTSHISGLLPLIQFMRSLCGVAYMTPAWKFIILPVPQSPRIPMILFAVTMIYCLQLHYLIFLWLLGNRL